MSLIAAALTFDPLRDDWLEVVDAIAERSKDPLALAELEPSGFFGLLAVRALLLAKLSRHVEALALQLEVAAFRPDIPYLAWARRYLTGARLAEDDLQVVGPGLSGYFRALPTEIATQSPERANAEAALAIVRTLRRSFPRQEQLAYFEGLLLRKLGAFEEAKQVCAQDVSVMPSWFTAVGLAASYRALGLVDEALESYRLALQYAPRDVATLVDIADLNLDAARYDEASAAYTSALEIEPEHPWASASQLFVTFRRTGETQALERLKRLAQEGNERARQLLER